MKNKITKELLLANGFAEDNGWYKNVATIVLFIDNNELLITQNMVKMCTLNLGCRLEQQLKIFYAATGIHLKEYIDD